MEAEKEEQSRGIFSKIESREGALKTIKDCAIAFIGIAAIQAVLGYFLAPSMMVDALLYAVLAGIMLKWNSRVAAVVLLLLASFAACVAVLNRLILAGEGGSNVILALLILWVAIRAVDATYKANGKYADADI